MTDAPQAPERPPVEMLLTGFPGSVASDVAAYAVWLEEENRRLRDQLGEMVEVIDSLQREHDA